MTPDGGAVPLEAAAVPSHEAPTSLTDAESIAAAGGGDRSQVIGSEGWNANGRKIQEESDVVRQKLMHQDFSPVDYPDPLLPRGVGKAPPFGGQFPPGAEEQLRKVLGITTASAQ